MDRSIPGGDLIGRWSLSFADIDFVNSKPALTRLGLAAQLKFFASLGFFAIDPGSIPTDGLSYLAEQLGVEAGEIAGYDFSSRTARRHCAEILIHPGYHRMKRVDRAQLTELFRQAVLSKPEQHAMAQREVGTPRFCMAGVGG